MRWLKRVAVAFAIGVVAVAASAAWFLYGAWPVPEGYEFPRHSIWGGGPGALFEGTAVVEAGCLRTGGLSGGFTVVWPPGYRLVIEDGQPVVHGGSSPIRMGQLLRMGGGFYESGDPPPTTFNLGGCPAPYFLSTGLID